VHDPFNPVSAVDILRLWPEFLKLALVYVTLAAIIVTLSFSKRGQRFLAFGMMAGLPVFAFGILWSGGDMERYLPLYPAFFLALAFSWSHVGARTWLRVTGVLLVLTVVGINAASLSGSVVHESQDKFVERVGDLLPRLSSSNPNTRVFVSHWLDELPQFIRNFPFKPINRDGNLRVCPLLTPGAEDVPKWREDFASRALAIWHAGGDVWVSKRLLQQEPRANWNWVEGDDPRVSWLDLYHFFSSLEYGEGVGANDGFVLLAPSTENRMSLSIIAPKVLLASTLSGADARASIWITPGSCELSSRLNQP
jgi:hypothetical protein